MSLNRTAQPKRPITVIPVPFDWGASRRGAAEGPQAIILSGLERKLQQLGFSCTIESSRYLPDVLADIRSSSNMRHWGKTLSTVEALAHKTAQAVAAGQFPLVLGGDHSIAIGSIAGAAQGRQRLGVLWIDAHGDLNTPDTTPSGNIHGMSLACCLGHGDSRFVAVSGQQPKVEPDRVVLVGARQLDPGERELIRALGITCFTMHDIDRYGMANVMEKAIRIVSDGTDGVHLSFDIDSVDPGEAPGTGTRVRGGFQYREVHLAMEMLAEASIITSADIVEVNPLLDNGYRTARLAVELIASLFGERIL
ncbi:arginase [Paenibacillus curdlanolyticus YK9]|uniref:Arginase n=1 Tax=Paenibacillus curdlanolyticus YK9 TaxID=717606 RepID=E0I3Z6_9BACL|nr:arginase [Paenibacillus curdlanolyticus]EFM13010.1 arginase [Paenibacillus curdlanolyticus YK9]